MLKNNSSIFIIIITFCAYTAGIDNVNYYYWPAVVYTKNEGTLRGRGYFLQVNKFYGSLPKRFNSTGNIFVLDGRKIGVWETDSIQIHQFMGYPADTCYLFKVISGTISIYVHDLSPWLKYGLYPVIDPDFEIIEITPEVANRDRYIDRSHFTSRLLKLKNTFAYLQFHNEERKPYSDSLLCRLVSSKTTSFLYTQPRTAKYNLTALPSAQNLMAIVDFNRNSTIKQVYIDSLYLAAEASKNDSTKYKNTTKELRQAFSAYNAYNIKVTFQFYLDNGIVYLKNREKITGHVYFSLDYSEKEKREEIEIAVLGSVLGGVSAALSGIGVLVIPPGRHFIGTFGIESPPGISVLHRNVPILFIDGRKITPDETDSVFVNGYTGYPDSLSWRFKVIDGNFISAYSHVPFRYLRKYQYLQKKDGTLHPFSYKSIKNLLEDYPMAYLLRKYDRDDSLYNYRALDEYNNHSLSFANQADSIYKLKIAEKPGSFKRMKYTNRAKKYLNMAKHMTRADSVYAIYRRSKAVPVKKILSVDSLDYRLLCLSAEQRRREGDKAKACELYTKALRYTRRDLELKPYDDNKIKRKERAIRRKLKSLGVKAKY